MLIKEPIYALKVFYLNYKIFMVSRCQNQNKK